jgi:hypothetical protein
MVARMAQDAMIYTLGYMTLPSSPVRLPSPPFIRYNNAAWHRPLGDVVHDIVLESFPFLCSPGVGIAVIVAWSVLWANRRWRPEPSWIDRTGRLLGVYWVGLALAIAALSELWQVLA